MLTVAAVASSGSVRRCRASSRTSAVMAKWRPSRISIADAVPHPTPLVESVAMGSITAPVPEVVPQLPSSIIAGGALSAAQAETLIYAASAHARDLPGRFEPDDKGCALKASA